MKNMFGKFISVLLFVSVVSGTSWAQGKIGTVDMRKLFDNYWKKKQAETQIQERRTEMEKEIKSMMDEYKKDKEEYQNLLNGANDQAVSPEERDKRKRQAEDKLKTLKDSEVAITQYERTASNTLQEQNYPMRSNIIADIQKVVNAKAKTSGYSMVIDTAAESVNRTPVFLYTTNENDLTEAVLLQLNERAPTDLSKTDEKPAPEEKKKDSKK